MRLRTRTTLLLAVALVGVAATGRPVQAAPTKVNFDFYQMINIGSNRCLSNLNSAGLIRQDLCDPRRNEQLWTWQQVGTNIWKIRNFTYEDTCVSTVNGISANETPLDMWGCGSSRTTLKWRFYEVANPNWQIQSAAVERCIARLPGTISPAPIYIQDCGWYDSDQTWRMQYVKSKPMYPLQS